MIFSQREGMIEWFKNAKNAINNIFSDFFLHYPRFFGPASRRKKGNRPRMPPFIGNLSEFNNPYYFPG